MDSGICVAIPVTQTISKDIANVAAVTAVNRYINSTRESDCVPCLLDLDIGALGH